MSILVNRESRILVQGFTGSAGSFHSSQCLAYGTRIVGGVTPGRGGSRHLDRPVFDTVSEAVRATGADVSLIFVPARFAADSILEAAEYKRTGRLERLVVAGCMVQRYPEELRRELPEVDAFVGLDQLDRVAEAAYPANGHAGPRGQTGAIGDARAPSPSPT